ncbi:MAG: histidinol dehydrogenase [Alphaproteobacteria bacterium]|nr:histidinol dehydrogenase [Alphaproteobacteria bacterium]
MPTKISSTQADFEAALTRFFATRDEGTNEVGHVVTGIITDVRTRGDEALLAYTKKFDRFDATPENIKVDAKDIANALALCSPELMKSLKVAAQRIADYSRRQLPQDLDYTDDKGVRLGHRWSAIDAVGLYVPGGTAFYPSSVLMNAVPAKVAGVSRLVMMVPSPEGALHPALLAAAHVAGVDEIYKIGGAQAVAALAYGTKTIAPVDKIVGPGNAYVAEAKRQVFGQVGIDMIAGPSEILVIADNQNNPDWIAADLLSQAEHDTLAQSVLITNDSAFADAVAAAVETTLKTLPRQDIARKSWEKFGGIILVQNWDEAAAICNRIAPEHLEIAVKDADALSKNIRHAGAIFLGRHTPEAIGDYVAGPSHVLPTSRTARFSSGLSVFDFIKRSSIIGCTEQSLQALSDYAHVLATTEGLDAHALSVSIRRTSSPFAKASEDK